MRLGQSSSEICCRSPSPPGDLGALAGMPIYCGPTSCSECMTLTSRLANIEPWHPQTLTAQHMLSSKRNNPTIKDVVHQWSPKKTCFRAICKSPFKGEMGMPQCPGVPKQPRAGKRVLRACTFELYLRHDNHEHPSGLARPDRLEAIDM